MKVLHIIQNYSSLSGFGPADRCHKMVNYLASQGHEVAVFTTNYGLDRPFVDAPGVETTGFPYYSSKSSRYCYSPSMKKALAKRIREFDVVHLITHWTYQNIIGYQAARKAGIPYIFSAVGTLPIVYRSIYLKKLYNFLYGRAIIQNANAVIAITKLECQQYRDFGIDSQKIHLLPNAIDLAEYSQVQPGLFRNRYGIAAAQKIILFLGRLNHIKGPDILLEGFIQISKIFADAVLVYVGPDQGMQRQLQQMAHSAGIQQRVIFCGSLVGEDKVAAYTDADLFIVPSRRENMSIVALEACACNTPVVITDACDFGEIETSGAGRVVSVDSGAIASAIQQLLESPEELRQCGQRARAMVEEQFTWDKIGQKLEKLLEVVVE